MRIIWMICLMLLTQTVQAQDLEGMTQRPFGQSRVQYKDFDWKMKYSPNFEIYYYAGGEHLADLAIRYAETEYNRILNELGHNPTQKTKLFVYNSIADLQQSNIGLHDENRGLGGQTSFIRPKIEIPYTGSLFDFKKEVTSGMARIYLLEMMYGGSIREIVQNSLTLNLPEWYTRGVTAYVSEGWNEEMDDYMRAMVGSRKIKRPDKVVGHEAQLVGLSIWNFISEKYGKQQVANILNMTRILRSYESSITNTLQISYKTFLKEWKDFYLEMADQSKENYQALDFDTNFKKWNKKAKHFNQLKISPDGKYIAYSLNQKGRYTVLVRDLQKKTLKKKTIFKVGFFKNNQRINPQMPLLAWSDQHQLAIAYQHKGVTMIRIHDLNRRGKKIYKRAFKTINQISGMDISADGSTFAISADRSRGQSVGVGQNDLVLFNKNTQKLDVITPQDLYDDIDPVFIAQSNDRVIFSSNRRSDSLKAYPKTFDAFQMLTDAYNLYLYDSQKPNTLTQLTFSSAKAKHACMLGDQAVLFLANPNGIQNIFRLDLKTMEALPITNSIQDIRAFGAYLPQGQTEGVLAFRAFFRKKRREEVVINRHFDFSPKNLGPLTERIKLKRARHKQIIPKIIAKKQPPVDTLDTLKTQRPYNPDTFNTDDWQFDPKVIKEMEGTTQKAQKITKQVQHNKVLEVSRALDYVPKFATDRSITTPLIDPLRGFGVLFEVDMSEMLENHRFTGGVLGIMDLRSTCYFAEYQYLAKRLDYSLRYDRKNLFANEVEYIHKYHLNKISGSVSYPFSNASKLGATLGYMDTRFLDIIKLSNPSIFNSYLHSKMEFAFDNTTVTGLNMRSGTRMKVSYQHNLSLINSSQDFNKMIVDIRNYQPIDRDLILATRLAFGRFGGKAPKRYVLGGMDNWIGSKTGESGKNDPLTEERGVGNPDLLFTDFATNLRGFEYNKLAGHSFMVFNAELRVPIVKYIFQNSVSSNFFKNLQFSAFGDIGTAWDDKAPWKKENDFNTYLLSSPPFNIEVNNFTNPYLAGYGLGVRSLVFGYYLKVDVAWGLEDYQVKDEVMTYFTLGYDF